MSSVRPRQLRRNDAGRFVIVTGPLGAGKSTIARTLADAAAEPGGVASGEYAVLGGHDIVQCAPRRSLVARVVLERTTTEATGPAPRRRGAANPTPAPGR